ncbi:hypothetical protein BOX15_Mlig013578g1, partial [Macrostomum lignano]
LKMSDTEAAQQQQQLDALMTFPPEVEAALQELVDPNDPLDQANFCATDYINRIFPTEQSLAGLDDVLSGIRAQIAQLDSELRVAVQGESASSQSAAATNDGGGSSDLTDDSCTAIDAARAAIADLFDRMRDIKERADRSEAAVLDLTRDIRRLDTAKRNLTGSITALNQVVILINGVDEMKALMLRNDRPYDALAQCLGKIHEVTAGLDRFMDVPQLQQLRNEARSLEAELSGRVKTELRDLLTGPPRELQQQRGQVEACCRLADLMEFRVRTEVLDKFVQQQLAEYAVLFEETQEAAWLTKIDSRFGWMKKFVLGFEERYARLFPSNWRVTQRLVKEFCDITRSQLSVLMQKRAKELDVKLLLFAVERTRLFEEQVVTAFKEKEDPSSPAADPSASSTQHAAEQLFTGAISQCFAPHLGLYTDSVDRNLAEMLQRWTQDVSAPLDRGTELLPSCADLFMVYKNSLKTCAKLSCGQPMLQLARVFAKYLREYANKILLGSLPTGGRNAQSAKDLFRELMMSGGVGGGFFSESTKLSNDDLSRVCVVICTAEYCLETTNQLEAKLRERINEQLTGQVDLRSEKDNFHSVINACVQLLVSDVESACEPPLTAMQKMSWNTVEAVGDQSPYVSSIGSHLSTNVPVIRDGLTSSRKYFTQFCSKFVSTFAPKFRAALFKCRPVSTVGAEQLLLDTHSLKTLLLSLPSLASPLQRKPPAAYTKLVVREMTKAEMLMKVVLSEHTNHQAFVESFCRLLPDSDLTEYQKVLDMKGVKRSEQMALIDAYRAAKPNDAVLRPSPSASSLSAASAGGGGGGSGGASSSLRARSRSPAAGVGNDKSPSSGSPGGDASATANAGGGGEEGGRMKRLENLLKRL